MARHDLSALKKPKPEVVDKRNLGRLDLRRSDGVLAQIEFHGEKIDVQVFDISPYGICFKCSNQLAENFHEGDLLKVWGRFPSGEAYEFLTSVCWKTPFKDEDHRVGLRINTQKLQAGTSEPHKKSRARDQQYVDIEIPEKFPVMGGVYKPNQFFERATIRLTRVSGLYFEFIIFDTEIILFSGMNLTLLLQLNLGVEEPVDVCVEQVQALDHGKIKVKAKITKFPESTNLNLAELLVWNCDYNPEELRTAGLNVKNVANGFRFRYIKTQDEYIEVLKLRLSAYKLAGKVKEGADYTHMAAPLDHISRILVAYHGKKIVASVAIAFPDSEDLVLDTERAFPGGYPKKIPKKTELIEISRLCTDVDYRRSDVLGRLFEYTYKTLHCGERKYILTSTDSKLWPLYKKLGFKKTGMDYDHPYLEGINHSVIVGDRATPDQLKEISPLVWNYIWRDMNNFLQSRNLLNKKKRVWISTQLGKLLKINLKKDT